MCSERPGKKKTVSLRSVSVSRLIPCGIQNEAIFRHDQDSVPVGPAMGKDTLIYPVHAGRTDVLFQEQPICKQVLRKVLIVNVAELNLFHDGIRSFSLGKMRCGQVADPAGPMKKKGSLVFCHGIYSLLLSVQVD